MRKLSVLLAGAAVSLAATAFAGVNPLDPGLPQNWTTTTYTTNFVVGDASGALPAEDLGRLNTLNSFASAFCVECHTRNPSALIPAPSMNSTYDPSADLGSHAVADVVAETNTGGGFAGGSTVDNTGTAQTMPRIAGEYEKTTTWAPNGQTGYGLSKYGDPTPTHTRDSQTTAGDMICESCHNVLVNNGNQLTLLTYEDDGASGALVGDAICVGCHTAGETNAADVIGTYSDFHNNDNLSAFLIGNPAGMKRHHVLDGDTLATAEYDPDTDPDTNDSLMWAPSYTRELSGGLVAAGAAFDFGKGVSSSGQGALSTPLAAGDIATGTSLQCVSCHRPHNAVTTAGAFILRTGDGTAFPGAAGAVPTTGLERQSDTGSHATAKVYGEYRALCNGCHTGYDQ